MALGLVLIVLLAVVFWFIAKWWYRIWFGVVKKGREDDRQ